MHARDTRPPAGELRPARAVATLMALVLGFLGASTLASAHLNARGGRGAEADVVFDGSPAMWMGGLYLALAAMPLGLWFRTPRAAGLWTAACGVALVACLAMVIGAQG